MVSKCVGGNGNDHHRLPFQKLQNRKGSTGPVNFQGSFVARNRSLLR